MSNLLYYGGQQQQTPPLLYLLDLANRHNSSFECIAADDTNTDCALRKLTDFSGQLLDLSHTLGVGKDGLEYIRHGQIAATLLESISGDFLTLP